MSKSKLLFVILSLLFLAALFLIALDFSSKTSFPGGKHDNALQNEADSISQENRQLTE